jgi:hypothetical protein
MGHTLPGACNSNTGGIPMRTLSHLVLVAGAACLWSASAVAQTKFSATDTCGKADPQHTVPVGDRAGHALGVEQLKCHAAKPMEIGGDKAKEGLATDTFEASGDNLRFRGVYVVTMQSGDKAFMPYQGTGTTKEGKPVESKGTWSYVGGSGKLKGIKGKGTFHCTPSGEEWSCDIEGEYELAK